MVRYHGSTERKNGQTRCLTCLVKIDIMMKMRNIHITEDQSDRYVLTRHRRLLLELIRNAGGHIDAKELYRRASREDDSISLATVYRALRLFKETGLVSERRLGQIRCCYEVKQSGDHHHLLCTGCGKVIEFESGLIDKLLDQVQRKHGFKITKAELYLEGHCQGCGKETGYSSLER